MFSINYILINLIGLGELYSLLAQKYFNKNIVIIPKHIESTSCKYLNQKHKQYLSV